MEDNSLKCQTIITVFDGLPLEKKRKLIPELLKSARIVHGFVLDPIEPKFKSWLCRGKKKIFTEEEAEKVWLIWNYVKKESGEAFTWHGHQENSRNFSIGPKSLYNCSNKFSIDPDNDICLTKDEYFAWILENTIPEEVCLCDELGETTEYTFPDQECSMACNCNMIFNEEIHNWNLVLSSE